MLGLAAILGGAWLGCSNESETAPSEPAEAPSSLGRPVRAYGERSKFETAKRGVRDTKTPEASSSRTPLADTVGILTPSALHFERHHAGVPDIDPVEHELVLHGLVERPLVFTVAELKRLPSESHIYFVECSGNSGGEWNGKGGPTVQLSHGLASCSEWTGVPLRVLLKEAGLRPEASWLLAEGADACRMSRSVPMEKALDDALVAYGQNGEALRPEQGYPLRLVLPGYEGNACVKWLRRIQVSDQPFMTKDETSKYTDLLANGKARRFSFVMEAKSVITRPSGGLKLEAPGFHEITGVAWSGRGRITKVEVTTDGGETWQEAELGAPRLPRAFTRFRLPWRWQGEAARIASRAFDESGYRQPLNDELLEARGPSSAYHHNGVKWWTVAGSGKVSNV